MVYILYYCLLQVPSSFQVLKNNAAVVDRLSPQWEKLIWFKNYIYLNLNKLKYVK